MTQEQCGCEAITGSQVIIDKMVYSVSGIKYCPLHAAAPELLKACEQSKMMLSFINITKPAGVNLKTTKEILDELDRAIKKAKP